MEGRLKWILLASALCLLLAMPVMPVSGLTTLAQFNTTPKWVSDYTCGAIYVSNISRWQDIQEIKFETDSLWSIDQTTNSTSVEFWSWDADYHEMLGTGTYTYSVNCAIGTWCAGYVDITIDSLDIDSYTGSVPFYLDMNKDGVITGFTPMDYSAFINTDGTENQYYWQFASLNGEAPYGRMTVYGTIGEVPVCSFTANPTSGQSPLEVTFTDTSTGAPTSWDWIVKNNSTGYTEEISSSLPSFTSTLYNPDWFDIWFNATNAYGSCELYYPRYITVIGGDTITFTANAVDILSHGMISGATIGVQNTTSTLWTNCTAPTGTCTFSSTDGAAALPFTIGQSFVDAAVASGYKEAYHTVTLPYSGYSDTIFLMPVTAVNETGTFWLTVTVTKNEDGTALNSAVVQVLSGGSNYQQYTDDYGMTTFQNITSGYTFSVTAFAQAYTSQTKVLEKTADFMNTSFSLVRIGGTPVTTPATPSTTQTTAPVVTWTNPQTGQPVSQQEGSALDAILKLALALPVWVELAIGVITIWLLWIVVYEITGGKVIDKILRRGKGGKRRK